ncbi:MAG: pyridoxal phosphate-dependent aminotransferase [Paramuribaculum sp.]|nr:pyridoxal phosphate-dependent aminotransferase [Paramuribaculum sp.]MDE7450248.1 pyridoxal phosphate-dependent aminotransferase [Paramuribaculum sp.]
MFPLSDEQLLDALQRMGIGDDISRATIRQIVALSGELEDVAQEPYIHLELGNPGLPACELGVAEECRKLAEGIANQYPNIAGIPRLKEAGSRFVKAFIDVDIPGRFIVPTVGSMQGTFTMMLLLGAREKGRDTVLYLHPGFSPQLLQSKVLGLKSEMFDIYNYRGKALEAKLEEILSKGNVTAMLYSNPNNPAWTNFTEEELEIIGRMANRHDVIVMEDMAYIGMDFRSDLSRPGEAPFVPTVARYTDNYVIFISGSKIFSYAGQRIALVCVGPRLGMRNFEALNELYHMPTFIDCFIYGVLYCASSGTAHSAQYALAAMMEAAVEGKLDFVDMCREYGRRAAETKKVFTDNGFNIVYECDGDGRPVSDGFFFTAGYKGLSSAELQGRLMRHGVATIALSSTGSEQDGVRVCVSLLDSPDKLAELDRRLKRFVKETEK